MHANINCLKSIECWLYQEKLSQICLLDLILNKIHRLLFKYTKKTVA